jgi:pyrrolidone-carboxylate peptidase
MGYTGFRKYQWNPAEAVAERLNGRRVAGCIVESHVMPVSLSALRKIVPKLLETVDPAMALGVGLAPSARSALLELAAANYAYFEVEDEGGYKSSGEEVEPGGPRVVHTTIPVEAVMSECKSRRGLPLRPSVTIGTYLCGALGYMLMRWGIEAGRPAGFIHVPPDTGLAMKLGLSNYISLRDAVDSVECILEATLEHGGLTP